MGVWHSWAFEPYRRSERQVAHSFLVGGYSLCLFQEAYSGQPAELEAGFYRPREVRLEFLWAILGLAFYVGSPAFRARWKTFRLGVHLPLGC